MFSRLKPKLEPKIGIYWTPYKIQIYQKLDLILEMNTLGKMRVCSYHTTAIPYTRIVDTQCGSCPECLHIIGRRPFFQILVSTLTAVPI